MKRRYKILGSLIAVLAIAVFVFGMVLAHESPCPTAPMLASGATSMKAWVYRCYGGPEVLQYEDLTKPVPADDEVLVKVRAASVNPLDWHYLRGKPYLMRMDVGLGVPKDIGMGVDFAGVVESTGKSVTHFKAGDEVFGAGDGAFGEYVKVREIRNIAIKPANLSFAQASAVPVAAITALQALRDIGKLKAGQKVLINGASGGVGTFAVQIAKSMGAEVTGVCSGRNVEMVRSLGADHVVDYTKEDFTKGAQKYDVIVDTVGNRPLSEYREALVDKGIFVIVGGSSENRWLGPFTEVIKAKLYSPFVSQSFEFFLARITPEDLATLSGLMTAGKLTPVIDRSFKIGDLPEAIRYVEAGHTRGKVVVDFD